MPAQICRVKPISDFGFPSVGICIPWWKLGASNPLIIRFQIHFSRIGMRSAYYSSRTDAISEQEVTMNATQLTSKTAQKTPKATRLIPELLLEIAYLLHTTKVVGRVPKSPQAHWRPRKSR
jgi:hypothetical protein